MKKVGLYFGTFNPIHVGHLIIANYMVDFTELDEVWFVVSPQNPLKDKKSLLKDYHRLALVQEAIVDNDKLHASDIEFSLPKPSYTSDTLAYLHEKHPDLEFSLIMGEDNLRTFHKWKNYESILQNNKIIVYPRVLTEQEKLTPPCGACRQVIAEFFEQSAPVIAVNHKNEQQVWTVNQLLPDAFTPKDLLDT